MSFGEYGRLGHFVRERDDVEDVDEQSERED